MWSSLTASRLLCQGRGARPLQQLQQSTMTSSSSTRASADRSLHSAADRLRRGRIPRKRPPPAVPLWAEGDANAELPAAAPAASSSSPASSSASSSSPPSSELSPPALSQLQPPSPSSAATAPSLPPSSAAVSPTPRPPPILPAQLDPAKADNILLSLLAALRALHFLFYAQFSPPSSLPFSLPLPAASSLPAVLSDIKRCVLRGCHLVFSGVFPSGVRAKDSEAGKLAEAFGAVVSERLGKGGEGEGAGEEEKGGGSLVTHVVAAKDGSDKVKQAMRLRRQKDGSSGSGVSPPFVVHLAWLHHSVHHFQRADEAAFPLSLQPPQPASAVAAAPTGEAAAGKEKEPSRASVDPALIQHAQQSVTAEQLINAVQSLRSSEGLKQPHAAAAAFTELPMAAASAAVSSSASREQLPDDGTGRIKRKRRPQTAAIRDTGVAHEDAEPVKQRRTEEKSDTMADEEPPAASTADVAFMTDDDAAVVGDGEREVETMGNGDEQTAATNS